jgi:aspartyl-tRNA(Asn)/glutamyl-tRNA(Gln) amidotransferase subunit A
LTIVEASAALRRGEFTPVDLVTSCLQRIEETDETLKAWITVDSEGALRQAESLLEEKERGPLWGIPIGVKDIIDVEGLPTTAASTILAENIASTDAPVVSALRGADAVILGKTNTHEFAYGVFTPPTNNPWDPSRIPGGSSGGSAAALAASQCLGALGSDTGGSIRIPASLCGIAGLKPRHDLLPTTGIIPLAKTFDAVGPMARTVEDLELMWQVLAEDLRYQPYQPADTQKFRVAVLDPNALPPVDPEIDVAFQAAVEVLSDLASGSTTFEIPESPTFKAPSLFTFDRPRTLVLMVEALEFHRVQEWWPKLADEYTPGVRDALDYASKWFVAAMRPSLVFDWKVYPNYEPALSMCRELGEQFSAFLKEADLLVTPTLPRTAPTHEETAAPGGDEPRPSLVGNLTRIPSVANVSGLASLNVLCGFTDDGLPIGLQLIGRDEALLLVVGARYERATGWTSRRPPIVPG